VKIVITGGTGFVGRHLARRLLREGHEVVLLARGEGRSDLEVRRLPGVSFMALGLDDAEKLAAAFSGCAAVIHCAGINREIEGSTYERVHVGGSGNVVAAARRAGVRRVQLISFLRARANCGSAYLESKWAAEEIFRHSGLDFTVFKCGVIYGRGDHLLAHLSRAFHTFPLFALVGFRDKTVRPVAVEDIAQLVARSLSNQLLSRRTLAVLGPEELTLREAVRRVARVVGKNPLMFPLPVWFHHVLGCLVERFMVTPLVSVAQVGMLSEGLSEPWPPCELPPPDLAPGLRFTEEQIRQGLPPAGPFGARDLRCCRRASRAQPKQVHRVFLELP
jgi:NADH dehydrogenase